MDLKLIAKKNNWKLEKLDKVTFFQEGPGVRNHQYTTNGVKLLNVANLFEGQLDLSRSDRFISEDEAYGKYSHFLVDEGDLIIACSGIQVDYFHKKMGFAKKEHLPLCMNTSTMRFKTLDENILNLNYLAYYLKTDFFKKQIQRLITGSAQLNFGPSHIKKIDILIPPLETQKKIVEVLDKAQGLIDARKEQIRLMDELIQSVFYEMFGDPVTNPKGWEVKKLGEIGSLERGKSKHRPRNAPELLGGKYPLVQTGDISNAGLYIYDYSQTYSELGLQQSKIWDKGTLCVTIAANIARTSILGFDACFPDSIVAFIPNENVESMYVQIWFGFLQKIIEANAPESAQKNINLKILRDLDIPLPDIYTQKNFCKVIDMIEAERKLLNTSLTELENNYHSMMKKSFGNGL